MFASSMTILTQTNKMHSMFEECSRHCSISKVDKSLLYRYNEWMSDPNIHIVEIAIYSSMTIMSRHTKRWQCLKTQPTSQNFRGRWLTSASSNMVNSPGFPRLNGPTCSPSISRTRPSTCHPTPNNQWFELNFHQLWARKEKKKSRN